MTSTTPETSRGGGGRRRSDRADLVTTLSVGVAAAGVTVVLLIVRLVEIFAGERIDVPVAFAPTTARVPGPDGATATVDTGTVSVGSLPPATFASVVLAEVVPAVAALVVIACAVALVRRLLAGRAFAPGTARLLTLSSFAILIGWVAASLFGTMASTGALAAASPTGVDATVSSAIHVSWLPLLAAMAVGALAMAFRSGEKLQVDSDGLV